MKLSPLEEQVYEVINRRRKCEITLITTLVYLRVPIKLLPKIPRNSVVSAIRQINRKFEKSGSKKRIVGENRGRYGKVVWIE